jgi:hypothetical protein
MERANAKHGYLILNANTNLTQVDFMNPDFWKANIFLPSADMRSNVNTLHSFSNDGRL